MPDMQCRFCEQDNPAGSHFCNSCGAQLNLKPCPRCGAINEADASACRQCSETLASPALQPDAMARVQETGAADHATPVAADDHRYELVESLMAGAETERRTLIKPPGVAERRALTEAPALAETPAREEPRFGGGRYVWTVAWAGVVVAATIAFLTYQGPRTSATASTSGIAASGATRPIKPPAVPERTGTSIQPDKAIAGSAAVADRGKPSEQCTDGVAALGLCNPTDAGRPQTGDPATTATIASGAPRAGHSCSEAAAVVGLCESHSTQGGR